MRCNTSPLSYRQYGPLVRGSESGLLALSVNTHVATVHCRIASTVPYTLPELEPTSTMFAEGSVMIPNCPPGCLVSGTAQHSTAQHSTAQHSTAHLLSAGP